MATFKAADVLLAEARDFRKPLLGQALVLPNPPDVWPTSLRISMQTGQRITYFEFINYSMYAVKRNSSPPCATATLRGYR